ncbi:MAG: DUF3365 domain-containing protein [Pirellulaceae bacterium]|nr:DUF3365 domain-containing protein [Pirellulaceae bacterium]
MKRKFSARFVIFSGLILAGGMIVTAIGMAADQPQNSRAIERTRREIRMLDDIYKTSIVLITTHYVDDKNALPAGSAFKALFEAVKKKGWHEVRLLDATGDPYEPANAPKEGFEKRAIEKIVAGQAYYDEVVTEDGKQFLLGATAIPVVMEKCTLCHDNYKNLPPGKAIGALGYKVPILD